MSKISIIMPVYNAEQYLREAIESVIKQTYTDFELLLIDDKSTDNSKEICREYFNKDERIILLENNSDMHGPGSTRNIGLNHIKGEYIFFMDSDDWIESDLLESAVKRMEETDADIVQFGVKFESGENNENVYFWKGKDLVLKDEIKKDFLNFWKENRFSLWLYLFRTKTVKNIKFEDIMIGEDVCYVLDALCNVEKIAYISNILYHYRVVNGSTSHRWISNTIKCREIIWKHKINLLKSFHGGIGNVVSTQVAYDHYLWSIYLFSSKYCPLSYSEKKRQLLKLNKIMEFDKYRDIYPLRMQYGIQKLKYLLVKYHFEGILLLFGPKFLQIIRRE